MQETFKGVVVKGEGIAGRMYGVATANLNLHHDAPVKEGIYAAWVDIRGQRNPATICYGVEPEPKFEVHIIDFSENIIGEELTGEIVEKVSEYVHGYSPERLRQKILHDIELCREILRNDNDNGNGNGNDDK